MTYWYSIFNENFGHIANPKVKAYYGFEWVNHWQNAYLFNTTEEAHCKALELGLNNYELKTH